MTAHGIRSTVSIARYFAITTEVTLIGREYSSWSVFECFSSAKERMVSTGTVRR